MYRQQGMIVIVPVVLLLGMVAASCSLTLQSLSLMTRFSQHMQQALLVHNELHQQLQQAATLARANVHKQSQLALPANIVLTSKAQQLINGVLLTLYEFSYTQQHLNGGVAVLNYPVMRNIPPAGLMLFTPLNSGSALNITLLPDQLRSIWSPFAVPMTGPRKTCVISSPPMSECTSPLMSGNGMKGADIDDSSANFPANVSEFLFGQTAGIPAGIAQPSEVLCHQLNSHSHGFFLVQAHCSLPAGYHIGSPAKPVLLIIHNASVSLAANSRIFGIVVSMNDGVAAPSIKMQNGAQIQGAMMVTHETTLDSQINILYDRDLLLNLQNSESLQTGKIIKGSWRDF